MTSQVVYIGASSPLLSYEPFRNGVVGSAWAQIEGGSSQCTGSTTFSVELFTIYYTDIAFVWQSTSSFEISCDLDGQTQAGQAGEGGISLSGTFAQHVAKLETSCSNCGNGDIFELIGVKINTQVSAASACSNATLDDASPEISYTGFTSTTSGSSSVQAISSGLFFNDTVSYTSTAGAAASFNFQGSALYIFGPTGPAFGLFSVAVDGTNLGTFNASTTVDTYDTLLFFETHLDETESHQVVLTNQQNGLLFALDYCVAVQSSDSGNGAGSATTTAGSPAATPVWTGGGGGSGGGSGNGGAVIGGVIGGLAGLGLLFLAWRYHLWKKAGGEGDFLAAMCGPARKPSAKPKPVQNDAWFWPMMRSKLAEPKK